MLELYDFALKRKLETLFENVIMAPPEQAFDRSNKEGKVKLPLVSAYRLSNPPNWEYFNHNEAFFGRYNQRTREAYILTQGIPVLITYQIDIWAYERFHADGIYREILFYFLQNPNLKIDIPTADQQFDFVMQLTDVETATDYDNTPERNMIHRYTMTYEVPSARMFMEGRNPPYLKEISVKINNDSELKITTDEEIPEPPEEVHDDPYKDNKDPINKVSPLNWEVTKSETD